MRRIRPDSSKIKNLRKMTKLSQAELVKKANLGISLRSYQRVEEGRRLSTTTLIKLARFFNNFVKDHNILKENITFDKLIKNDDENNSKKLPDYIDEQCDLKRISSLPSLYKIAAGSNRRHYFYNVSIDESNSHEVKNLVKLIDEYNFKSDGDNYKREIDLPAREILYGDAINYEFDEIDFIAKFNKSISYLKNINIGLYVGVFYLSEMSVREKEVITKTKDPLGIEVTDIAIFEPFIKQSPIIIYSFEEESPAMLYKQFFYKNYFYEKKLIQIIKNNKFNFKGTYLECDSKWNEFCLKLNYNLGIVKKNCLVSNKISTKEFLSSEHIGWNEIDEYHYKEDSLDNEEPF